MATTASLLNEYGSALCGSWGDIDGRTEKAALASLSDAILEHGSSELSEGQTRRLRNALGVCPTGEGHWTDFCDIDCNEDAL